MLKKKNKFAAGLWMIFRPRMCVCALVSSNAALARLTMHPGLWLHFPLQVEKSQMCGQCQLAQSHRAHTSDWKCRAKCHPKVSLLDLAHSTSKRKINFIAIPAPLPWLQKVNSSLNGSCLCIFPHRNTLSWGGLHFLLVVILFLDLLQNRLWPTLSDWWCCSGR